MRNYIVASFLFSLSAMTAIAFVAVATPSLIAASAAALALALVVMGVLAADGAVVVLPERAVMIRGSGGEILALCDSKHMTCEIATAFHAMHLDAPSAGDDVHDFIDEMRRAGVLEVNP